MIKKVLIFVGLSLSSYAQAASYTYSWSGIIERPEPQFNSSDPFGFGGDGLTSSLFANYSEGKQFGLTITLDSLAIDSNTYDNSVCSWGTGICSPFSIAEYAASSAILTIGDSSWSAEEGSTTIYFNDGWGANSRVEDQINLHAHFLLPQGMLDLRSASVLSGQAFALTPLSVNPVPALDPGSYSQYVYLGQSSDQYHLRTYGDLIVGVVPVPAAAWLFSGALCLLGVVRRRVAS